MKVARHVQVTGRVQGVFFRAWTREQAERLGVHGWVRNCADGSVEAHIEGAEDRVGQMVELMRHGPSGARVDDLEARDAQLEMHGGFSVRH
jgi:acylphosphatase